MPRTEAESKILKSEERRKARELKQHQPTVKDVLLEQWKDDLGTYHMAVATIHRSVGGGFYTLDLKNSIRSRHTNLEEAIESQITYLNSLAEVEV